MKKDSTYKSIGSAPTVSSADVFGQLNGGSNNPQVPTGVNKPVRSSKEEAPQPPIYIPR